MSLMPADAGLLVGLIVQALFRIRRFIGLMRTCAGSKRSPGIVEEIMDDEDHAYRLPDSTDPTIINCTLLCIMYDY